MAHFTCEVVYRGIFQKNLAARICRGIVLSARKAGRWGIAFGRYGDSPQRNGIPAKDFAIVADTQEELEQNMARYEPKEVDVTICVDDTLSKGVESWAWYGLQPINRLTISGGTLLMTSLQSPGRAPEGHPQEGRAVQPGPHPGQGLLLRALGLQGRPHRGAHPGRPGQDPARVPVARRGVPGDQGSRVGLRSQGGLGPQGPRAAREPADQDHRGQRGDPVLLRDAQVVGDAGGGHHPGHPHRQADGGRQGLRARSATRTSRSSPPAPCGR